MSRLQRPVLSIGRSVYRWADVVLAMCLTGEYWSFDQAVRAGLACQRRAAKGEELPRAAVKEEEARFRRERNLLSADDTEAWLAQREITRSDWRAFVEREALRREWSERLEAVLSAVTTQDEEVDAVLWVEGVCSGALSAAAHGLARHLALLAWARERSVPAAVDREAVTRLLHRMPPRVLQRGIAGLEASDVAARAEPIAEAIAVSERAMEEARSPQALDAELAAHGPTWLRIELELAVFPHAAAAREAMLLVREDGQDLREAAGLAGVSTEPRSLYLDEVEPILRSRLLAAGPGDLVGPLEAEEGHQVLAVERRVEPSLDDPEVAARASRAVVSRFADHEVARRVEWHDAL